MNKWLLAILLTAFSLLQAEEPDHIVVSLSTGTQLFPLYMTTISAEGSGLDSAYVEQLQKVLEFDLNHNGMTSLSSTTPEQEQLAQKALAGDASAQAKLKSQGIYYLVAPAIKEKKAAAKILALNSNGSRNIEGLQLTGNNKTDRKPIHQLADAIHKALFNTDGIAATKFVYTVKSQDPKTKKWISEVWEADYDGANAKAIIKDGFCVTPCYVPPKTGYASGAIFYVSYEIGQPKIYVASLNEAKGRRFSLLKGNQLMPCVSKQRDKVAFVCDVTGNPDLFIQSFSPEKGAEGKPRQIYSTHLATQGTPTFSPDGKKIAFVSNKDGSPKIYVIDIPAEGVPLKDIKSQLISKQNRENTAPCWSPDGTKIAYCSMSGGTRQIWVYDFEKQRERQITQGSGNKENPTWAPNSLHLIFNSSNDLYLINLNQPEATKISFGPGEKRFPSWEPR